jgi:hypothetical protein
LPELLTIREPLESVTPGQRLHAQLDTDIALIDAVHLRLEQKLMIDVLKADFA